MICTLRDNGAIRFYSSIYIYIVSINKYVNYNIKSKKWNHYYRLSTWSIAMDTTVRTVYTIMLNTYYIYISNLNYIIYTKKKKRKTFIIRTKHTQVFKKFYTWNCLTNNIITKNIGISIKICGGNLFLNIIIGWLL